MTFNRLLKKIRTRILPQPLQRTQMSHICKMILFLATLMKLMMTLLCNWSRSWNQMRTRCNQVIERSKKQIPKSSKENKKKLQQKDRLYLRPRPSKYSLQMQQLKALISTASLMESKTPAPRPKPKHNEPTAPSFKVLPIPR